MSEKIGAKYENRDWSQLEGLGETPGSKLEWNGLVPKASESGSSNCEKMS